MVDSSVAAISLPVEFIEDLSRAVAVEQVLAAAARWLPDLLDADRARLTFREDAVTIARGFGRPGCYHVAEDMDPVAPGSPRARVLESRLPLQITDAEMVRDPSPEMQHLYDLGMRAVLVVPMLSGTDTGSAASRPAAAEGCAPSPPDQQIWGTICVARRSPGPFAAQQVRHLTAAGAWIASRARLMQQLRANARMAETDPLTGLANRARLMRVLDGPGALHLPDGQGRIVGVLHLDLDRFKEINDRFGHAAGDAALRHAAGVMQGNAAATDLVARVGGDEFVIVTRTDPAGRHLAKLAAMLVDRLGAPAHAAGHDFRCPASIGTAMAGPRGHSAERLIADADIALYHAKRAGRGGVCAFHARMRSDHEAALRLRADLHLAVRRAEFAPFFQPVLSLGHREITSFELLARWPHAEDGLRMPATFLPAAAEAGLTARIEAILRTKGLRALAGLRRAGWTRPVLSLNVSAGSLADPDLTDCLLWEIGETGLTPADVTVEIAQSDLLGAAGAAACTIVHRLAIAGIGVEIDGFTAGFEAVGLLRALPIRGIKAGRALTSRLSDPCNAAILGAVLTAAAQKGATVTATGVEQAADIARLAALECHRAQGHALFAPLPAEALGACLAAQARTGAGHAAAG